ncbi:uncharacterized protein LOC127648703 [Xyrauchen texanus]|uniref:uncharacterized protein LOC127648703 n=1 Tax=Xyrauchen texanus TaxID=154827 RepID=UPI002241B577|nr:uncharacterized protein LOC127648703 [Xyrauchen texanus]
MKFIYLTAFLCSLVVMGVVSAGNDGPVVSCCLEVSNIKMPLRNIKDYRIQNSPLCPLKAVVFITVKNKHICSDLEDRWAKHAMYEVDRKKSNKQPTSTISILTPVRTGSTHISMSTTTPGPEKITSQITYKTTNKVTTPPVVITLSPVYREKEMSKNYKVVTSAKECCLTVTKNKAAFHEIVDYRVQETPLCSLRAIQLQIITNKIICSDPENQWAKKAMMDVDKRKITTAAHITSKLSSLSTTTQTTAGETKWISTTTVSPTQKTMSETMFKIPGLDVVTSAEECCLTVAKNKPVFHEIVDYRVQETSLCTIRAVVFITMENKTICASLKENWVQDYIQNLNRRRKTTETTDNDKEFVIMRTKPIEQNRRHSTVTIETATAMSLSSIMNDPFHNTNNLFCVKEPAKYPSSYFCIKQP